MVVREGQHIAHMVRQIYEALAEQFREEDIPYHYRFKSCEVLKAGTGLIICAMLTPLTDSTRPVRANVLGDPGEINFRGRPLGKTFFLLCQRRHPELPKIPTYLPHFRGAPEEKAK